MSERPLFSYSMEALEKLFDESRESRRTLQTIGAELLFRSTGAATQLLARVQQAIAVLPMSADEVEEGIWGEYAKRLANDEKLLIARSPVSLPPDNLQQLALWPQALEMGRYGEHMLVPALRRDLARGLQLPANSDSYGLALRIGAFEIRNGAIRSWPGFALFMRKVLGDRIVPWLPSLFLAAIALPDIVEPPEFELREVLDFKHHT